MDYFIVKASSQENIAVDAIKRWIKRECVWAQKCVCGIYYREEDDEVYKYREAYSRQAIEVGAYVTLNVHISVDECVGTGDAPTRIGTTEM